MMDSNLFQPTSLLDFNHPGIESPIAARGWVEVRFGERWVELEGFILDAAYLGSLKRRFKDSKSFCGFGAATSDLQRPQVEWNGGNTYIQSYFPQVESRIWREFPVQTGGR